MNPLLFYCRVHYYLQADDYKKYLNCYIVSLHYFYVLNIVGQYSRIILIVKIIVLEKNYFGFEKEDICHIIQDTVSP